MNDLAKKYGEIVPSEPEFTMTAEDVLKKEWASEVKQYAAPYLQECSTSQHDALNRLMKNVDCGLFADAAIGSDLAHIILVLTRSIQKEPITTFLLTVVDKAFQDNADSVAKFNTGIEELSPFSVYLKILFNNEKKDSEAKGRPEYWYIRSKACSILSTLLTQSVGATPQDEGDFVKFLIASISFNDQAMYTITILNSLKTLMKKPEFRVLISDEGAVTSLSVLIVAKQKSAQILYQALCCLWLITFNKDLRETITDPHLISKIVEIVKTTNSDKVIRMGLAVLKNLLGYGNNDAMMIGCGLMRHLEIFQNKQWGDEEIEKYLETLKATLEVKLNDLSSFELYKTELMSQKLDWSSPVHRSERFWRGNILSFTTETLELLRAILLNDSGDVDSRSIAVALFDIGEFARFHPFSKKLLETVDVKVPISQLLQESKDIEVKKEALLALQKIMIHNWESLSTA